MTALRRAACILLAAASILASPAYSTSFSTDQSDIWYTPGEPGWAIQLIHRGSVIFGTIYVYGPSNAPTWYVATMNPTGGVFTWSGDLYATTGPYFGTVPFNSANVVAIKVGTMTWAAQTVETSVLTYDVNGVTVVKNVTRYTSVFDDFSGHYGGGIHQVVTGCPNPALNGTIENIGVLNITQNGSAITLQSFPATVGSCSFPGTFSQAGQMGGVQGSYVCSDGGSGTFTLFEMQVNITGFTGRFVASSSNPPGCQITGWFGGLRVTTF
jgi:hypothetical protein